MPTIYEPSTYQEYLQEIEKFKKQMDKSAEGQRRAEFSDESEKDKPDIRRFLAYPDGARPGDGAVAGWTVLKVLANSVKIEGVCVDPNLKKGVAKLLITTAVNVSWQLGKGGTVTLTNMSHGTGNTFYSLMGFKSIDGPHMRLDVAGNEHWDWRVSESNSVLSKKGNMMYQCNYTFMDDFELAWYDLSNIDVT